MKMDRHLMRLSMLVEIGRAMRVVQNEEEIIRMMAEFAAELAYGDFVCVVWFSDGQTVVVHEGAMDIEMAVRYRDDVCRRYGCHGEKAKSEVPVLLDVEGKSVMEVPVFRRRWPLWRSRRSYKERKGSERGGSVYDGVGRDWCDDD